MARRCLLAFKLKLPAASDRAGRARPAAVIAVAWAGSQSKIRTCAAISPATAPGTPLDRQPMMLPSVVPSGFRYMSRDPASGATSR